MARPLISFVAPGTVGDVLPLLSVAEAVAETELARVAFACHERYQDLRRHSKPEDPLWTWRKLTAAGDPEKSRGAGPSVKGEEADALWEVQLAEYEQCVKGSALVVFNFFASPVVHACERWKVRCCALWPVPFTPTSAFPSFFFSAPKLKACIRPIALKHENNKAKTNLATWAFWESVFFQAAKIPILKWRALAGLQPASHFALVRKLRAPILYCWSPSVLCAPSDWPSHHTVCGYIRGSEDAREHSGCAGVVKSFSNLKQDGRLVYVGFGSATSALKEPAKLLASVVEAVADVLGEEGCVLLVSKTLTDLAGGVSCSKSLARRKVLVETVDYVPHASLLPIVDIIIHHGGAGTFGEAAHSGCAQIVIPLEFDNFFWAEKAHALGVAPKPLIADAVTSAGLAASLHFATSPQASNKVETLQGLLSKEDGRDVCTRIILGLLDL